MNKLILGFTLLLTTLISYADGSGASQSSADLSSQGLSQIVAGSANIIAAGSELSIASIHTVGDMTYITLKTAGKVASTTIKVSTIVLGHASLATGQMIKVTSNASGYLLYSAGKIIAFIPNEFGKSLLYSQIV